MNDEPRHRVAVIVQRYGLEVNGGAERAARAIAEHLMTLADVEVLTTCALDFTTWANHYPAGTSQLHGLTLRRFPVDRPRDWRRAARLTQRLLAAPHSLQEAERWIREQGPYSTPLLSYLTAHAADYDFVLFFTYVYATTYFGLPLVADRAILVPTAHDEPYLYLEAFAQTFRQPSLLIHLTEPERDLVRRVVGEPLPPQLVVGLGLDAPLPESGAGARFRARYGVEGPFLLYAGRITESKNVGQLLDYFARYRREHPEPLQLVLLGQAHMPLPARSDVISLGFVPEQDKFDAYQAADLFVNPSVYESLSIVCLEAWEMGTPVLVNGDCEVLRYQCRQSQGGLYYTSYDEFAAGLSRLLASPSLRQRLGRSGQAYVRATYHWDVVLAQYRALFSVLASDHRTLP